MRARPWPWIALGVTACAALVALFYFPLGVVVARAVSTPSALAWADPFFTRVIGFTYLQAFLSAALSAAVGIPGALLYSESDSRYRQWWSALSLVPFSLPPVLVVLGLLGLWGRQGWVGQGLRFFGGEWDGVYGWSGILLAHVLFNFPLFVRLVGQALTEGDRAEEKVALSLGASRTRAFRLTTWPKLRGAFWSAFVLAFLFSASSFLVVLILGGGPRFTSIEVAVFQAIKQDFDPGLAVKLAGLQMAVAVVLALCVYRDPTRAPRPTQGRVVLYRFRREGLQKAVQGLYAFAITVLVAVPLLWILYQGIPRWGSVEGLGAGVRVSLQLAFTAGLLSTVLALAVEQSAWKLGRRSLRSFASLACTVPLAVSSLLVLLGWRLAYPGWLSSSSQLWWAVALVQALVALPVVHRALREGFNRLAPETDAVARSLGAGGWQRLIWVQWPALRGALLLAFLLGVLISLGEAGAVLLFLDESTLNLTYLIYQSMGRYRFADAYAFAAVLLVITAGLSLAAARLEREPR